MFENIKGNIIICILVYKYYLFKLENAFCIHNFNFNNQMNLWPNQNFNKFYYIVRTFKNYMYLYVIFKNMYAHL